MPRTDEESIAARAWASKPRIDAKSDKPEGVTRVEAHDGVRLDVWDGPRPRFRAVVLRNQLTPSGKPFGAKLTIEGALSQYRTANLKRS